MSSTTGGRVLGTLGTVDGRGVVRIRDRYATDIDDLWQALTDPRRLARWLGDVAGDLRPGGEFRAHFVASGWEGTGRIEACEAPHRLLVVTRDAEDPHEHEVEATLTADGDGTLLVIEERGVPLEHHAAYGAGNQIHAEDLADHVAGRERRSADGRWEDCSPPTDGCSTTPERRRAVSPRGRRAVPATSRTARWRSRTPGGRR